MRDWEIGLALDILRKITSFALTVMILLTAIFVTFMVLAGDPALVFAPKTSGGDEQQLYQTIIDEMRLNDPWYVQYVDYVIDTLTGDFRVSSATLRGEDIQDFIWDHAGNTVTLLSFGLLGSFVFGALLERLAVGGRGKVRPLLIHGFSLTLLFIPAFSLALIIMFANVELGLGLPLSGDGTRYLDGQDFDPAAVLESAILPSLTVVLSSFGLLLLFLREGVHRSVRDDVRRDSWLSCFASGLVRIKPVVHFHVVWTMSVALIVDMAFSYRGLGTVFLRAMYNYDFPTLMAVSFIVPMMVMAVASVISVSTYALSGRPVRESLSDWGRRDPVPPLRSAAGFAEDFTLKGWVSAASRSFRSLRVGMLALTMLVVLVIVGVLALLLEPSDLMQRVTMNRNQAPSWEHLLGTDVLGRDVMSIWLSALGDAVLVMLALTIGCLAIGLTIGFVAIRVITDDGLLERLADFFLTPVARVAVVTPLVVVLFVRAIALGGSEAHFTAAVLMFHAWAYAVLMFYAWAWLLIARPVRAEMRALGSKEGRRRMTPNLVAESLSVAKFAVPLIMATRFSLAAMGMRTGADIDFGSMFHMSYVSSAFVTGDWHLIIPPLAGILLVCATAFVLLDRMEYAARAGRSQTASQLFVP